MVSIAVGAGLGGAATAMAKPMLEHEERKAEQDWEIAKYDSLRSDLLGDLESKRAFETGIAGQERLQESSQFMLENMAERYKSINNRLKGEAGFKVLTNETEIAALEAERKQLRYNMQALGARYLAQAGQPPEMLEILWPRLFTVDEDGDLDGLTDTAREIERAAANERLDRSESEYGSMDEGVLTDKQIERDIRSTGYDFPGQTEKRKADNKRRAEAFGKWLRGGKFKSIVKFVAGGGEAGDAHWEEVKRALTEELSQTEVTGGATISDERASEIVTDKIQEGLKTGAIKISDSVMDILKKGGDSLKNIGEMGRDQIREAIRAVTTIRVGQVDTVDDETLAQMDEDMASGMYREFASTDDEGMLAAGGGGGLIKRAADKYTNWWDETVRPNVGGRLPQEFWDFYEKNPQLYQAIASGSKALYGKLTDKPSGGATEGINLGVPQGGGRLYGETRPEDFIGSTQAIDDLGRAGGPAADALTEWTPESSKARLMEDVKNLIRRAESARGGYNAVAGRKDGDPDLTSMTIGEIHKKYGDKAVGVGQFKRRYLLNNAKKYLGYDSKELDALVFDRNIQEQFLEFGIEESGIDAYIAGTIDVDKFQANLAIRWRGLPPLGTSLKGDPSDEHGNIIQVPGSEAQEILELWKDFQN